ncbi:response regulator [Natronoglycomyces albus]|uniref:Response regulator n=1 Tax=Natronoglycomyces albus TaxID=2811108 RepID=A0A895XTV6_9ACTN|nr:response regulator [Natronoglycomyces albus]
MKPARGARVLLVDDRQENLLALEAIMQGMPVTTVAVNSGEEALKKLLREDFAVILLDAQMPGMDGFETARHIKQREKTRHTPIIFLTAADRDSHLAMRGYSVGAVDYITKPFDPWMLRTKIGVFIDLWDRGEQLRTTASRAEDAVRRAEYAAEKLHQVAERLDAYSSQQGRPAELESIRSELIGEETPTPN